MKSPLHLFSVLFIAITLVTNTLSFGQTIPNAGFENWNTSGFPVSYEDPDDWYTPNQGTAVSTTFTVTKTTDAHSGNYAIRLETKDIALQTIPGTAIAGAINPFTLEVDPGFAIPGNPASLSGWYKYFPILNLDVGSIEVLLSKWNPTLGVREPIGSGTFLEPLTVSSYTEFTLSFIYVSSDTADTAIITLLSGSYTQPPGSILYVDDLSFDFSTPPPPPVAPVADFNSANTGGGTVAFTDQSSNNPTTWFWTFGDGGVSTQQNPTYSYPNIDSTYYVCLTVTNLAGTDIFCDSVTVTAGVPSGLEILSSNELIVYPNPASDRIHLTTPRTDIVQMEIRDLSGRLLSSVLLSSQNSQMEVGGIASGTYIYILLDRAGMSVRRGMIVITH